MIDAGSLDRYISLAHRVLTPNSLGENVESWPVAYAKVWANQKDSLLTRRGDKVDVADQFTQLQLTQFQIRYRDDLVATDKLTDQEGLTYEIVQMVELGRHEGLSLLCKAVHA